MRACGALAIVALAAFAADADAGVIRGRIQLGSASQAHAGHTVVDAGGPEQAVVWVDSLPPGIQRRFWSRPIEATVIQAGRQFAPRVTVIPAGSRVRFTNRDDVYHNAFSVSPVKPFDLGKYPPRSTHRVTFDKPGVVNLYCDIHPGMAAWVVAVPYRLFARPTRTGHFTLPALPAGHYVLRVWHPALGEVQRTIEVPRHGDADVALSF